MKRKFLHPKDCCVQTVKYFKLSLQRPKQKMAHCGNLVTSLSCNCLVPPPPSSAMAASCTIWAHHLPPTSFIRKPNRGIVPLSLPQSKPVGSAISRRPRIHPIKASPSPSPGSQTAAVIVSSEESLTSAAEVVRGFYDRINGRDLESVEDLIAESCVYEDLVFPQPFVGRKAILEFFGKFNDSISNELQFVIDNISTEDNSSVGVTWHLEWNGKAFPFSKGCSFYQLKLVNGRRQITYGRDCVEPAIKPGEATLVVIRGVTWLFQQFPQLAEWL